MQLAIIILILICAVSYAAIRVYNVLTNKKSRCYGCPLIESCSKTKEYKTKDHKPG